MYFCLGGIILAVDKKYIIQLLEYPIPQKPSSADISETESGIIDPLVSKQPEKISNKKKLQKNFKKTSQRKKKIIIKKNIEKSTNEGRYQAGPKDPEPARRAAT